jgi:hypothetical protein
MFPQGLIPFPEGPPGSPFPTNPGPPFTLREQEMLARGMQGPALDELDLAQLAQDGLLPEEWYNAPDLSMFGRNPLSRGMRTPDIGRRVLEDDHDMATRMPELGPEIVARRGSVGDAFRMLEPNNLGNGVQIPATTAGTVTSPVNQPWVTVFQARGIEALNPIGVALGFDVTGPRQSTDDIFVQARVKWGVGGGQNWAVLDVGRGTQIRLASASFLEVAMRSTPDPTIVAEGVGPRTSPQLLATALAGYGTPSFRPSPARYTQRVGTVLETGGLSSIIAIPKWAQSFGVVAENTGVAGCTAILSSWTGADPHGHTEFVPLVDDVDESQYYVSNGMGAIQLVNNTSTAQRFNIVWSLML